MTKTFDAARASATAQRIREGKPARPLVTILPHREDAWIITNIGKAA